MKYAKVFFTLAVIMCLASKAYCATSFENSVKNKVIMNDADSVAARANQQGSHFSGTSILQDPMMNSMLNGYGSMMQGMTGGSYNAQEQYKQQKDYAKQQAKYQSEE